MYVYLWWEDKPVIGVFIETATAGEDYERYFSVTEHRQLVGFLEQPIPALAEGDLPVGGVLDPLDLDFAPSRFPLGRGKVRGLAWELRGWSRELKAISTSKNQKIDDTHFTLSKKKNKTPLESGS